MKVIMVADLHLSDKPRDEYRWGFMRRLIKLVAEREPKYLIVAGDITEEKDHHRSGLVNNVVNHFAELAKFTQVLIVEGNHDYKEEGAAFFQFLERIPRLRWIGTPTILKEPRWLLVPHTNDWKRAWKNIDFTEATGVVAHQTFNTASVGFGRKLEGVPTDAIPVKCPIFAGDVHVPQTFGNLTYIGAPYTVDFGDDFKSRILQWEDGKVISILTSKWPQKRAVAISTFSELMDCEFNEGDIVQVTVDVEDLEKWDELRGKIAQYMLERLWTPWAIKPRVMRKAQRRAHRVRDRESDEQTLEAFGKRLNLKPKLIARGKALL